MNASSEEMAATWLPKKARGHTCKFSMIPKSLRSVMRKSMLLLTTTSALASRYFTLSRLSNGCALTGSTTLSIQTLLSSIPGKCWTTFMNVVQHFPGMELSSVWMLKVVDPVKAQPLLNLLNVKYLLAKADVVVSSNIDFRITDRSDFGIIENLQVWPRAFFGNQVAAISSDEAFIQYLLTNGQKPFIALSPQEIEKQPGLQRLTNAGPTALSTATHYRLSPNATEFDVHAASAGVVCLTEGQARDFTAKANNQPKEVLTVNRAFKGIYLDQPGDYDVQFTYRPRHWRLACTFFWISTGGVIMLALMSIICVNGAPKIRPALSIEDHEPKR